jgi:molybdopterin synthase sulfur carrier subunit
VKIEVLYFAQVREAMGTESEMLDVDDGATVDDVVAVLRSRTQWASIAALPLSYAVNEEIVRPDKSVRDGDRLALLPPVSGG